MVGKHLIGVLFVCLALGLPNYLSKPKYKRTTDKLPIERIYFAQMFEGKSNNRTGSSNLATSIVKAVADYNLLDEKERSLGNWSYDVTTEGVNDIIYSTTQFYNDTSNL